jgi:hypothetical protein
VELRGFEPLTPSMRMRWTAELTTSARPVRCISSCGRSMKRTACPCAQGLLDSTTSMWCPASMVAGAGATCMHSLRRSGGFLDRHRRGWSASEWPGIRRNWVSSENGLYPRERHRYPMLSACDVGGHQWNANRLGLTRGDAAPPGRVGGGGLEGRAGLAGAGPGRCAGGSRRASR